MSFTSYRKSFPPQYRGCCHTTPSNNEIGPSVISVFISGFSYNVLPVLRDIKGHKILPLDVSIHQSDGTLTLRIPCPPIRCRFMYVETSDTIKPTVFVGDSPTNVNYHPPIRDGYWLWSVRW